MKYTPHNIGPRRISIMLFTVFLFGQSCYYYRAVSTSEPPTEVIAQNQSSSGRVFLYHGKKAWEFNNILISGDSITGSIEAIQDYEYYSTTKRGKAHRYKKSAIESINESEVLNYIHITVSEYLTLNTDEILILTKQIENIEVNKPAKGATVATFVLTGLGSAAVILVAAALISLGMAGYL